MCSVVRYNVQCGKVKRCTIVGGLRDRVVSRPQRTGTSSSPFPSSSCSSTDSDAGVIPEGHKYSSGDMVMQNRKRRDTVLPKINSLVMWWRVGGVAGWRGGGVVGQRLV